MEDCSVFGVVVGFDLVIDTFLEQIYQCVLGKKIGFKLMTSTRHKDQV